MKKEFVCTLDGRTFADKGEAVRYLESQFLEEVEKPDGLESIEATLKEAFPDYRFKLTKRPYEKADANYQADEEFLKGKEVLHVRMESNLIDAQFGFSILEKHPRAYDREDEFGTLEEAIGFQSLLIGASKRFAARVFEEAKKFEPNAAGCKVERIHQTCGTADDFYEIDVNLVKEGGSSEHYARLELDYSLRRDMEYEPNLIDREIEELAAKIRGRYITEVEGEVTFGTPRYCNDHSTWYEVDGIAIDSLAERARTAGLKLRVQILNEKVSQ